MKYVQIPVYLYSELGNSNARRRAESYYVREFLGVVFTDWATQKLHKAGLARAFAAWDAANERPVTGGAISTDEGNVLSVWIADNPGDDLARALQGYKAGSWSRVQHVKLRDWMLAKWEEYLKKYNTEAKRSRELDAAGAYFTAAGAYFTADIS